MQKLSSVLKEAKKYLWDGAAEGNTSFICFAIGDCPNYCVYHEKAIGIVQTRLGKYESVRAYLMLELKVKQSDLTSLKVQKYRKDWLTSLEKEFKEIERKFPKGVHHLDGDKNNWDLSNLVGIEKLNNFREI